jgi:mannose-1-phosphate guanylyltransferase/mannose-6-phosphate isomerase
MIIKNTVKTALIILSTLSVVKALEKDALSHEAQGLPLVTIQQENREIIPVILCGGVGSRLWPISREQRPKPFMKLSDGQSFLQKALLRGTELPGVKKVMTVTNRDLFFQVRDEYEKAQPELQHTFLLEPFARNTAAAITLAALQAKADGKENSLMLVLAADHLIENQTNFKEAVLKASELAKGGKLVAFGIEPTRPETGYGYIQARGNNIIKFVEKPNLETATEYLESGDYVWNSGMFCFMPKTVLKEISQHYREILLSSERALTQAHKVAGDKVTQIDLSPEEFERVPICPYRYCCYGKDTKCSSCSL